MNGDRPVTTTHEQFQDLVAAYAFDAIDVHERQPFEAHLAGCESCREALADLRRASVGLGLSIDPVEPPADLRARTLAAAVSQPRAVVAVPARPSTPTVAPASSTWRRLGMAASVALVAGLGTYSVMLRGQVATLSGLLEQAVNESAAVRRELATARLDSARLVNTISVLGSADVVRVDLRGQATAGAAVGRAYVSSNDGLVFSAQGLPQLQAGRTYQLWVVPPGSNAAPIGVGTFDVDASGRTALTVPMPGGVMAAAVAVTEEPSGGSPAPTSPILLVGAVSS